jgi:UDP-N-acetylglucosamine:LPS N-acetylglucosamine transferase
MHESDSRAGLANRIVTHFAKWIFCSFPEAKNTLPEEKILGYGSLFPPEIGEVLSTEYW